MAPAKKKAPAPKTKALVTQPKREVGAPKNLAERVAADSGSGMEGADKDSFAIPFIKVLQDGSPQCKPGKVGYNPKAKPGMLYNTVTGELMDGKTGIIFIPCAFQRRFIQWGPRTGENSGYKGEYMPEDVQEMIASGAATKSSEDGKLYVGTGTNPKKDDRLSDTRNHFGLVVGAAGPVQALLSLSSTQIKKSKQLMGILSALVVNGKTPPTWLSKIRITTADESNDLGAWKGIVVEHSGFIEDDKTYDAGRAFHDIIAAGKARVNYSEAEEDDGAERF